jgi:hypothetical protein
MKHYKIELVLHSKVELSDEKIQDILYSALDRQNEKGEITQEVTDIEFQEDDSINWDEALGYSEG